jgi:hypothetical protein
VARGASGVLGGARLAGESQVGPEVSEIDRRAERRDRAAREIARPSAFHSHPSSFHPFLTEARQFLTVFWHSLYHTVLSFPHGF